MKLALVGLGNMGTGMARNLLRAGHTLTIHNRTRAKADALAGEGAAVAESAGDAVRDAEAVLTMLADDAAVEASVWGSGGLDAGLPPGAIHISCSTISTQLAHRLDAHHGRIGQRYLSAPVFGRPEAAAAGSLLVVAAGQPDLIDRCRPIFEAIGRQTFIAGSEPWQANALKLCGNFMIASVLESFGEANATLRKAGIDPHLFLQVMTTLFGSPVYANYGRSIADERFNPAGFALRLGLKDIRLVLETAQECQSPMPVASLIRDHMLSAMAAGQSEDDWSSLVRVSARAAGLS